MPQLETLLKNHSESYTPILDASISIDHYTPIDLSIHNPELDSIDIANPDACQAYIDSVLTTNGSKVAYGGYLEKRKLYAVNSNFQTNASGQRNVHLGVDFWAKAGTTVLVPLLGKVHSFKNNAVKGDYGPTIILKHHLMKTKFYTLYGHLSLASLDGLYVGKEFCRGEAIGTLGTTDINVNYAPHLHFQLIADIGEYEGDYPGVCTTKDVEYYTTNCPNPLLLLKAEHILPDKKQLPSVNGF